ncbi:SH3 domain-containing protein [Labrenzia sp. DG1229]|uniref:SH3 domain-containing protein n=1 Tax=Labrenzia sp. DG1229 TaxID=681847 RepID=UPI00048E6CA3|nr:SH3 domain-containing protein [Labrenzia sp. DG1229]
MYSVSAPANTCDTRKGRNEDPTPEQAEACDPRLISGSQSNDEFRNTLQSIDPSELAAKILQLHTGAKNKHTPDIKRPRMIEDGEEDLFEMPNVLQNRSIRELPKSDPIQVTDSRSKHSAKNSGGPSFRFLLASTLIIGLAGGAALALGLPEMLNAEKNVARPVETELILANPSLDAPSSQKSDTLASGEENQASSEWPSATPAQIAKAKDRIQKAFAVGGSSTPNPVTLARVSKKTATNSTSSPPRATDQSDRRIAAANAEQPPIRTGYPLLASNATVTPVPSPLASSAETRESAAIEPVVSASQNAIDENASRLPARSGAEQTNVSYSNTGRTLASVNMRSTEDKNGEIIAVIPEDTQVGFQECGAWWCGVTYQGKTGFVGQKYLERPTSREEIESVR